VVKVSCISRVPFVRTAEPAPVEAGSGSDQIAGAVRGSRRT
jgi:hypothetical protein